MANSVYSKGNKAGEIREVTMIERFFDIEKIKKEALKLAEDKKKVELEYRKNMEFIAATEAKIAQILNEAEKLGLTPVLPKEEKVSPKVNMEVEEKVVVADSNNPLPEESKG